MNIFWELNIVKFINWIISNVMVTFVYIELGFPTIIFQYLEILKKSIMFDLKDYGNQLDVDYIDYIEYVERCLREIHCIISTQKENNKSSIIIKKAIQLYENIINMSKHLNLGKSYTNIIW